MSLASFTVQNYNHTRPFASFLPGIAGLAGVPLWAFYVNRGQALASFGVESKDSPIVEFEPAHKAYQLTPYTGFRTFLKLRRGDTTALYEPFSPWQAGDPHHMRIEMNALALQTASAAHGVQVDVLYFTLPGEPFAALVRQVTVTNSAGTPLALEMLDGLPRIVPYGVDDGGLKHVGRTLEAWMAVFDRDPVPLYRLQASAGDTAQVDEIRAAHFYLAFDEQAILPVIVDPAVVFGHNTTLNAPDRFAERPLAALLQERQVTTGRTPCGFAAASALLQPAESLAVYAIAGHAGNAGQIRPRLDAIARPGYVERKRAEARELAEQLTDVVDTQTACPPFDAYCRQNFLDNVLRGGWPLVFGSESDEHGETRVYHVYSRKHGDLERDYNAFRLAAEMYSQGNGNYRDVNQNRRCDVLLEPRVGAFNVLAFLSLLQADGYNPLVVEGSAFTLAPEHHAALLALVQRPEALAPLLARPFTPGGLLKAIFEREIGLQVTPQAFVDAALAQARQQVEARHGEGYWIDHWSYNLDLLDTYLSVYPERCDELLFGQTLPTFDSPATVQPRARRTLLDGGEVRQYAAVVEDEEKRALIASRAESPNWARTAHGRGEIFRSTVCAKLAGLALLKFATLDPLGMGVEMEAGRPGWYDALNGLPGLFGSSLPESYELERLLDFLLGMEPEAEARGLREQSPAGCTGADGAYEAEPEAKALGLSPAGASPFQRGAFSPAPAEARGLREQSPAGCTGADGAYEAEPEAKALGLREQSPAGCTKAGAARPQTPNPTIDLPIEQHSLMQAVARALSAWERSADPERDFLYWDAVSSARERYREAVRLGFDGRTVALPFDELAPVLAAFRRKLRGGIRRAVEMNGGVPPTYFRYTVSAYEPVVDAAGNPERDAQGRPYVRATCFEPAVLPLFLEGPVHALKRQPDADGARRLYAQVRESALFDRRLGMYKVNAPLAEQPHAIGRARAFTPGWLENESIWLHMEYKYLLEVLRAGLYEEFFADLRSALVPFMDPATYGRSPLENSSFVVSSAHPDPSLHRAGFVARLSGSTAEFLSMWSLMMAGERPFQSRDGELVLVLRPALPGWLFREDGRLSFTFLGRCRVTYHNPARQDTFAGGGLPVRRVSLRTREGQAVELAGGTIGAPYAGMVRAGQVREIDVHFE